MPQATKRNFLIFWLSGWALFFLIGFVQPSELAGTSVIDMEQHRRAGTAMAVNSIHDQWRAEGVYSSAMLSLVIDLLFITAIAIGGILGGRLLQQHGAAAVRAIGLLAVIAHIVFALVDYTETLSQLVQMVQGQGSDMLAGIAAFARPIKMQVFLIGFAALILGHSASRILSRRG
ncbi:MAG: hypothetical protein AAFX04_04755 [Pseudomonadota bacterium]